MIKIKNLIALLGFLVALLIACAGPYTAGMNYAAGFGVLFCVSSLCSSLPASILGANTGLTTLLPIAVQALDVVSRELVGFIPGVNRDPRADRLAKNQTLYSWVTGAIALQDIVPGMTAPQPADRALGNRSISITNFKMADFYFTGEEEMQLDQSGSYGGVVADTVEQAVRTVANGMEADIALAAAIGGSRAYGTAGTPPFDPTVATSAAGDTAQLKKILDDNGAPLGTRSLVIDTTAGARLRTSSNITRVNEAGTTMTLRDGELLNLNGFAIRESAQVQSPGVGTASGATTNAAGYAVGATVITLASAGTGSILTGDVITFAGDTNKYLVASGDADVSNGGTITLAGPGLLKAMSAATKAITVSAQSVRNIGHSRNAILLATRLPARPSSGDQAIDVAVITDARSGISLELAMYPGYRQVRYEVAAAWGVSIVKPEHIAVLLG